LGFIGTVAVAALGYYQWRRTDKRGRAADFNKTRVTVLQTLVERLQQVQLLSRERAGQSADLDSQLKGLNEFLIERAVRELTSFSSLVLRKAGWPEARGRATGAAV